MKKILAITLVLCTLCLSSCGIVTKGVEVEQSNEYTKIVLDNFEGKKKIEIPHNSPNESGLYYSTSITSGCVTVSCDQGLLWNTDELFTADADNNLTDGGYYIDSNTSKITIIIESEQKTSGEILLGFTPFESEKSIKGIDGATKIEATKYDIGKEVGSVTITEAASVKHIVDNFNSLKLKELKYNELTAIEYELTFYNAGGETMKTISITLDGWVEYHGSLHSVVSGELDIVYIAGLFTAPDEEPGQNDILYAAAYPEDFEYNDRNYRLVQGDGLKTTATQEELGELLGYIIREEDVSAFTGEYPSVDYVIDNGIYDYYENNRVAFYSLNAYTDLSIVCMYQLGEYVLYQSETIS